MEFKNAPLETEPKTYINGFVERNLDNVSVTPEIIGGNIELLSPADKNVAVWSLLKERGLPVVNQKIVIHSFRTKETDITIDGSCVYDVVSDFNSRTRIKKPLDSRFVKLNKEDFRIASGPLLSLSNKMGVILPSDGCFHVLYKPDSSWSLVMLNLGMVKVYSDLDKITGREKLNNEGVVNSWVDSIETVRWKIERELNSNIS